MKNILLLIGASGHGKVLADIAIKMNKWERIAFLDDDESIKKCMGIDVIGTSDDIEKYADEADFFVAIGDNEIREKVYEKLGLNKVSIPILIHPRAVIGECVTIENGTAVMAGALINSSTRIGKGCIINTGAVVEHDNMIEDFVHVSPRAVLAGTVRVGKGSWIGAGSVVNNNVIISSGCIVGAGAVVVKDLPSNCTAVGAPAKPIKFNG